MNGSQSTDQSNTGRANSESINQSINLWIYQSTLFCEWWLKHVFYVNVFFLLFILRLNTDYYYIFRVSETWSPINCSTRATISRWLFIFGAACWYPSKIGTAPLRRSTYWIKWWSSPFTLVKCMGFCMCYGKLMRSTGRANRLVVVVWPCWSLGWLQDLPRLIFSLTARNWPLLLGLVTLSCRYHIAAFNAKLAFFNESNNQSINRLVQ